MLINFTLFTLRAANVTVARARVPVSGRENLVADWKNHKNQFLREIHVLSEITALQHLMKCNKFNDFQDSSPKHCQTLMIYNVYSPGRK